MTTTVVSGLQDAWPPRTATRMGSPEEGSLEMIETSLSSMSAMPSASMAHIAHTVGPPATATV